MSDDWEPAGYGQCGECGATGMPTGDAAAWVEETGTGNHWVTGVRCRAEKWDCRCGCVWWEQYRWRGQTKESRP